MTTNEYMQPFYSAFARMWPERHNEPRRENRRQAIRANIRAQRSARQRGWA